MRNINYRLVVAIALGALTASCLATRNADLSAAGTEPNKLLAGTAVGDARCPSPGTVPRPFVVEWDATDLATFEARASRDVVFVKYTGCEIEMLYGCSDRSIPGKYGRYGSPVFTSGTVESFSMNNEDELWAKLPLGAARFGASVKVGEGLQLEYFVSGVVLATRDRMERSTIGANPRCGGATHFVSSYNLGAFELKSNKGATGSVDVGMKNAGAGGTSSSKSANIKVGGDMESCTTQAQRQCRVPIRLVLEGIDESQATTTKPGGLPVLPPTDPPPAYQDTPAAHAYKLRQSARQKEEAGDGAGCIEDLDRALKLQDTRQSRTATAYTRAICSMRSGDCDGGKQQLREYLAALDVKRKATDAQIDLQVDTMSKIKCPVSAQGSIEDKATALMSAVSEAQQNGVPQGCTAAAQQAREIFKDVDMTNIQQKNTVAAVVMMAATCVAKLEDCTRARELWFEYYDMAFSGTMPDAEVKSAAQMTFAAQPACKGK